MIRPYRLPQDLDGLLRVFMDSAAHHAPLDPDPPRPPVTEAQARRRFEQLPMKPDRLRLVWDDGGRIVGLLEAHRVRDEILGRTHVYVDEIAVAADRRGEGIGTRLMQAAEDWAREHGAETLALDTMVANSGAIRLYERLGYLRIALVMRKNLQGSWHPPQG